jgi:hypothetical protein
MNEWSELYAVYEPIENEFHACDTLAEAKNIVNDLITCYSDDIPEEYQNGELKILKVLQHSIFRVIDRRENYKNPKEWPYDSDFDEIGKIEMVNTESAKPGQILEPEVEA